MQISEDAARPLASLADITRVATAKTLLAHGGKAETLGHILGTGRTTAGLSLPAVARASRDAATRGVQVADSGQLTGNDQGQNDRQKRDRQRIPKASVKIGEQWRKIDTLSPVGTLLLLGATMREQQNKGNHQWARPAAQKAASTWLVNSSQIRYNKQTE